MEFFHGSVTMYCSRCGKQVNAGASFCSACGASVASFGDVAAANPPVNFDGITRPRANRVVAGVCLGIARRYGWDVSMVRVAWLLAVVLCGTGVVAYIILWIAIPEESYALPAGPPTRVP
jgi:phage shock protein PspC (stress-responsive transcriptional regulator)